MTAVPGSRAVTSLSLLGPEEEGQVATEAARPIGSGQLHRLLTRQLFGYRTGGTGEVPTAVLVPNLAVAVPTVENGGRSRDGRTLRLQLRRGVRWDTQGARELTASDLIRGLKRVAHPTAAWVRRYFTETIEGMREYCDAYAVAFSGRHPTAPDLAQFQIAHDLAGLYALDEETLVIRLTEPATDILHILATGAAAAAPREYDYYLPDSHELYRNGPSVGPYRVSRARSRGAELVLEPNPRWDPRTDLIRCRPAGEIRIQAWRGHAAETTSGGPAAGWLFAAEPAGYTLGPYLVANLGQARHAGAMRTRAVRQAIAYAVNKAEIRDIVTAMGRTAVIQNGVLLPGSPGFGTADPYPTPVGRGDPDRARELLAWAGYPDGVALTLAIRDAGPDQQVGAVLRQGLARCGITVRVVDHPPPTFIAALGSAGPPWDLALASWTPAWPGPNGRTAVEPLLRGGAEPGCANYGGYRNVTVDRMMTAARRELDPARAGRLWREVEAIVMHDLPIVPIVARTGGQGPAGAGGSPHIRWFPDQPA